MLTLILTAATLCVLTVTLLPVWRNPHWAVRGWDFPRLQIAVIATLLLIVECYFYDFTSPLHWLNSTLTLICIAWQSWWIAPYTPLHSTEVKKAESADLTNQLSLLTVNVLTPNHNAEQLLALIHENQPDVLVTLESDHWWQEHLDSLELSMPYAIKCPLDNLYGMHVYSRLPISEEEISYLIQDDIPSMHFLVTLRNQQTVRMHVLHPAPPSPTQNTESAERDCELMLLAKSAADSDQPIVITGDLNDVAWSATTRLFRKVSRLLDPRVGRGMFNTYNAKYPLLRWPLDHTFHSNHFTLSTIHRLEAFGSDHFPLFIQLMFAPEKGQQQDAIPNEPEDQKMANNIISSQNADVSDVPSFEQPQHR